MHYYLRFILSLGLFIGLEYCASAQILEVYEYRYDTTGQLQQIILTETFDQPVDDTVALKKTGFVPYFEKHLLPDVSWSCIDTLDSLIFYRDCCNPLPRGVKKRVTSPTTCHDYHYYYTDKSGKVVRYLSASAEIETELLFYYATSGVIREIIVKGVEHYYFFYDDEKIKTVKKEAPLGTVELRFIRL